MENIETYLLILVAILEIVDGQGIALRILRLLMSLIGDQPDGTKTKTVESKEVTNSTRKKKAVD